MPIDYTDPGYPAPEGGGAGPFGQAAGLGGPYPVLPLALANLQSVSPWAMRRRRFGPQATSITPQFQNEGWGGSVAGGTAPANTYAPIRGGGGGVRGWGNAVGSRMNDPGAAQQSAIMQGLLGFATNQSQAMQHQYDLAADVYGQGDPMLRAYAALQGRIQGSGNVADTLSNAYLQQLLGGQDYARRYALQQLIGKYQLEAAKAGKGGSGPLDMLGSILGVTGGAAGAEWAKGLFPKK